MMVAATQCRSCRLLRRACTLRRWDNGDDNGGSVFSRFAACLAMRLLAQMLQLAGRRELKINEMVGGFASSP